ncbi:four helix bundle protein [Reichenbachiella carrageenanivorans]|uniref:four helix bundle protein n=1 Tax=Reichenbachiella carrageenanivorans TaxID=2979869 RepID=UPI00389AB55F
MYFNLSTNFLLSFRSACEVGTQSIIATRIELLKEKDFNLLNSEMQILQKMIFNLKKSL